MKIEKFTTQGMGTNVYAVINETTNEYLLIDPGWTLPKFDALLEEHPEYKCAAILLTHGHADHIMGVNHYRDELGATVYIHEDDLELLTDSDKNGARLIFRNEYIVEDAITFPSDVILNLADFSIKCLHTPGHTKGSVSFVIDDHVFVGDTLFHRSIGRFDLYGGSEAAIINSIRSKLFTLPNYTVWPGHGIKTSIDQEKENNPFVRA